MIHVADCDIYYYFNVLLFSSEVPVKDQDPIVVCFRNTGQFGETK